MLAARPSFGDKRSSGYRSREGEMQTTRIGTLVAGTGLYLALLGPAHAQVCAPRKVTATGATASFAFLARSSARSAWTTKVAREARLGPVYSQWLRSQERRFACRKVEKRHLCLAIALPCRSIAAANAPPKSIPANVTLRPL